jgi:hypothetical protein
MNFDKLKNGTKTNNIVSDSKISLPMGEKEGMNNKIDFYQRIEHNQAASEEIREVRNLINTGFDIAAQRIKFSDHLNDMKMNNNMEAIANTFQHVFQTFDDVFKCNTQTMDTVWSAIDYENKARVELAKRFEAEIDLLKNDVRSMKTSLDSLKESFGTEIITVVGNLKQDISNLKTSLKAEFTDSMERTKKLDRQTETNIKAHSETLYNGLSRDLNQVIDRVSEISDELVSLRNAPPIKKFEMNYQIEKNNNIGAKNVNFSKIDETKKIELKEVSAEPSKDSKALIEKPTTTSRVIPKGTTATTTTVESLKGESGTEVVPKKLPTSTIKPSVKKEADKIRKISTDSNVEPEDNYSANLFKLDKDDKAIKFAKIKDSVLNNLTTEFKSTFTREEFSRKTEFEVMEWGNTQSLSAKMEKKVKQLTKDFDDNQMKAMEKRLKKVEFIYELEYDEDKVVFKHHANTEIAKKKLSVFYVEQGWNRFVLVNYEKIRQKHAEIEAKKKEAEIAKKKKEEQKRRNAESRYASNSYKGKSWGSPNSYQWTPSRYSNQGRGYYNSYNSQRPQGNALGKIYSKIEDMERKFLSMQKNL